MQHCYVANNYNYQKLCFKLSEDRGRPRGCSEGIYRQNLATRLRGLLPEADVDLPSRKLLKAIPSVRDMTEVEGRTLLFGSSIED